MPLPENAPAKTFAGLFAVTAPLKVSDAVNVWLLFRNATFDGRFAAEIVPAMFVPCSGELSETAFAAFKARMAYGVEVICCNGESSV